MGFPGYVDYKSREFCNDVECPVQMELNSVEEGSVEYERIRQICRKDCKFSARDFHYWLMDNGYCIIRPE
jgi:hypothetical protein